MKSSRQPHSGFTLIELLVSISIFTVVITIAVGALLVLVEANTRAQNIQSAVTNVNFVLDSIAREVRTGNGFHCASSDMTGSLSLDEHQDCPTGGTYLSVVEGGESLTGSGGGRIAYRFNGTDGTVDRRVENGSWLPMTAEEVTITELTFYVFDSEGSAAGDDEQARATIVIEGYAGALASDRSSFRLQTTVSKRIIDV